MNRFATSALLLALALSTGCGGGDTGESISKEIMATMREMAVIMDGINDEASAKAAVPKIEATRAKMREIASRAKKVKVSASEEKNIEATMGKERQEVMESLIKARMKLQEKPELLKIIEPALVGMENDM